MAITRKTGTLPLLIGFLSGCSLFMAPAQAPTDEVPAAEKVAPPARDTYKGRTIAKTMHWAAANWLVRKKREMEEASSLMIKTLGVKPGDVVCDLGCGNGFHTLELSKLTGETGTVHAVDIQKKMLDFLAERTQAAGITNVEPIHGELHDPKLPENALDLVLMVDVYHEFSHPELMLKAIHKSLKPKGRVVFVEFREEDLTVPIKPLHKMSKQQILKEVIPNGFKLVQDFDELPWQHLMFFSPDQQAAKKSATYPGNDENQEATKTEP